MADLPSVATPPIANECGNQYYDSDCPTIKASEAVTSGNAVLLDEVLQEINSVERDSILKATVNGSFIYRYPVNPLSSLEYTLLTLSVVCGNLDCVKVLLDYKADIEGQGDNSDDEDPCCSPLFAAVAHENLDVLQLLVDKGADVNSCTNYDLTTPLMMAARNGDVNIATFLVEHGGNVNLKDKRGETALHQAINKYEQACDVLRYLIKNGADVNARTNNNCTPLMIASKLDLVDVVSFLIEQGANTDLADKDGLTALHYAVGCYHPSCDHDVMRLFIANGADVNKRTNDNSTPLMIASKGGLMNAVTFLTEHGANVNFQDKNGDTALHYAVNGIYSSEVVRKLLTLGASQLYNSHQLTPLLSASNEKKVSVVEDLIKMPEYTKEQRIDALELLGASLAAAGSDTTERAFEYMKRGMEERFADPSHPLLKQPVEPVEAYQNRNESRTLEELVQIEHDWNAIKMESLVIRERIIGTNSAALLKPICTVALYYQRLDNFNNICFELFRHAMKITQRCRNQSAILDLHQFTCLLYSRVNSNESLKQDAFLELLEQTVREYETQKTLRSNVLLDSTMQLLQMIAKYKYCEEAKTSHVSSLLKRLSRLTPRDTRGETLLHAVLEEAKHEPLPCIDTLKLLLNEGFNVNAVNNNGNTPLHRAVTIIPSNHEIHLLTGMLEVLLDGGAHHDFVNNDGKTAMDMAKTDEARRIISEKRKLELKCISARAVKTFGLPYLGIVPKTLEKYISMH